MGLSTTNVELGMEQATIEGVMSRHRQDPSAIIAILQDLQEEVNYLPEGVLRYVAERLDIPVSKVYSLATFYRAFSLEPRGRHLIHVCTGTACHVRGAGRILDTLERETGLACRRNRRADGIHPGNRQLPGSLRPGAGRGRER